MTKIKINIRFTLGLVALLAGIVTVAQNANNHILPLPSVPSELTKPHERADYLSMHFWDAMDFSDNNLVSDTLLVEQALVNFINILNHTTDDTASANAVNSLFSKSSVNPEAVGLISSLSEKYLYETNSPYLNEDRYLIFLNAMKDLPSTDAADVLRIEDKINRIKQCKPGTEAPELSLAETNLKSLLGSRPTILLFYDPDCADCVDTIKEMTSDTELLNLLHNDRVRVIAVDIADKRPLIIQDLPNWTWTKPADSEDIEASYPHRSLPSIYFIGPDSIILIKDGKLPTSKQ